MCIKVHTLKYKPLLPPLPSLLLLFPPLPSSLSSFSFPPPLSSSSFSSSLLIPSPGHKGTIRALAVADSEHYFVSSSKDKTVRVWSLRNYGDGNASVASRYASTSTNGFDEIIDSFPPPPLPPNKQTQTNTHTHTHTHTHKVHIHGTSEVSISRGAARTHGWHPLL